jgi:hypothetical protein
VEEENGSQLGAAALLLARLLVFPLFFLRVLENLKGEQEYEKEWELLF